MRITVRKGLYSDLPTLSEAEFGLATDSPYGLYVGTGGGNKEILHSANTYVFKTINCPAGTDPVAGAVADTLNLATKDSSRLTITGNESTDTVTFDAVPIPHKQNLLANSALSVGSRSTFENVSNQITVTDITNGVCTTADTEDLQVGDLVLFTGDVSVDGEDYEVMALTIDANFTIHDVTVNPGAIGGTTCYEKTQGFVATDVVAPDTWTKTDTLDIWRWFNHPTVMKGMFGVKCKKGANGAEYLNAFGSIASKDYHILNYNQGRPVTLGCWVYSDTAVDNVKLQINDSDGTTESSFVVADVLTWVEITRTPGAGITSFTPRILFDGDSGDEAYISEPILVYGSSIGEGNYSAPEGEIIWLDKFILSNKFSSLGGLGDTGATDLNLEADSDGRIPKGAKAVIVQSAVQDSGSSGTTAYFLLRANATASYMYRNEVTGLVNDSTRGHTGWQSCDADGDVDYFIAASGADTFDISYLEYQAVQVR